MRFGAALVIGLTMACGGPPPDADAGTDASLPWIDAFVVPDAARAFDGGSDAFVVPDAATRDAWIEDAVADDASDAVTDDAAEPMIGAGTSFRVTLSIAYAPFTPSSLPSTVTATLFASARADGALDLTVGTGSIVTTPTAREAAGWPVRWRFGGSITPECLRLDGIDLQTHVLFVDEDADGLADRVRGSGTGTVTYLLGDAASESLDVTVTVAGVRESDPPVLSLRAAVPAHVPVSSGDAPVFDGSEPMLLPTDAWLEATDGTRVAIEPFGDYLETTPTRAIGWSIPYGTMLPLDTTLTFRSSEPITDLDGHALLLPPTIATLPIPSPVANEGFELGTSAHLEGDARISDHFGTLPAITGARSVYLGATDESGRGGARAVVRLTVPVGATAVHVRARFLARGAPSTWASAPFRVAVYAMTTGVERSEGAPTPTMDFPTGDATWTDASEVVDDVTPLPSTATGEVVVVIGDQNGACGTLPSSPTVPTWIDDVRVE